MVWILLSKVMTLFDTQPYLEKLYKAMISTAYFSLFRVGKVSSGSHPILARDMHIALNKNKLLFLLCTSKTHWKNVKPQIVKISGDMNFKCSTKQKKWTTSIDSAICPYTLLRQYLKVRCPGYLSIDEPFFIFLDRSPVRPDGIRRILKKLLQIAGFQTDLYNFHGLRSGRAGDLLAMGLSVETIKKLGQWKSNCVYTYLNQEIFYYSCFVSFQII